MQSCPYFDCIFTNEVLFQFYELIFPMPKFGREHRASEMSETIRYMRGCGSGAYVSHQLQDIHGGHAHGGDFLALPNAAVVGIGTNRTNQLCAKAIQISRKHTT